MTDHPLMAPATPEDRAAYYEALDALTPKQREFVNEYLKERVAIRAYKKVYPRASKATVNAESCQYLENPRVKAALVAYDRMTEARVRIPKEEWLAEEAVIAFSDMRHYDVDEQGKLILTSPELPARLGRAVSHYKRKVTTHTDRDGNTTQEVVTEIRLWPKMEALRHVGIHLGFLRENDAKADGQGATVTLADYMTAVKRAVELGLIPKIESPWPKPKELTPQDVTVNAGSPGWSARPAPTATSPGV